MNFDNIINYQNYQLISKLYGIPIPININVEKKIIFLKNQLKMYNKVMQRNISQNIKNKNILVSLTNEELRYFTETNIFERKDLINFASNMFMNPEIINIKSKNISRIEKSILEYINKYFSPNYRGIYIEFDDDKERDNRFTLNYKIKVNKSQIQYIKEMKNNFIDYVSTYDGLKRYLNDLNFKENKSINYNNSNFFRMEGGSNQSYFKLFDDVFNNNPINPKYILEIGFNAGYSAIYFLNKFKDCIVVSLDLNLHEYSFYSKMFLDIKFPGRHIYIAGDSYTSTDSLFNLVNNFVKFDFIFIDGDHSHPYPYYDIIKCRNLSIQDSTYVLIDNYAPHKGSGIGPYVAVNKASKERIIKIINIYELEEYNVVLAMYSYDKGINIDYKYQEKLFLPWIYDRYINLIYNSKNLSPMSNEIKNLIINYNVPIEKKSLYEKLKNLYTSDIEKFNFV